MTDLIDAIHHHRALTDRLTNEMCWLASAFAATGNETVATKITDWAEQLQHSREMLSDAHGLDQRRQLHDAEQGAFNVMRAAMAGIAIGAKEPPHA